MENDHLWRQFIEGSDQAFYLLYDQYADKLYKYGIHFSDDKDFIKDCIHDLFLDLHKYRKKLSETTNVQFYLFRSLRRIIHKEHVRVLPIVRTERDYTVNEMPVFSHEDYLIATETKTEVYRALNAAMKKLTDRQREGLSLKFEHDHTYSEISEIMGISVESTRSIIYLALKQLRKSIDVKGNSIQLLIFLSHSPCS
ncbi:MAG: sigma-70 family RNA polymerase sigma factor [Prolixibacteraceae bacterium]|jgi:RNA polymerase sigma factor (sigma-70 family)|nr:sigma-70 family RNA polymerase sigma factor [Prolixibacteraceae bacterium]